MFPEYATHIANPELKMRIVQVYISRYSGSNLIAVLERDGEFYSADLIEINGQKVAAAVNLYADKFTAKMDAERRSGR